MTATERLRHLLDERGVEWAETRDGNTAFGDGQGHMRWAAGVGAANAFLEVGPFTPEQAVEAALGQKVTGQTSDGYHTFDELYHHRAVLFSVIVANHRGIAWKARKHHDGTMYEGMFIVGIDTPWGQASYHYDLDPYWGMFDCEERESAPEWDGHTPDEAIERIGKLATLGRGTCKWEPADFITEGEWWKTSCGESFTWEPDGTPNYCPGCGKRVVDEQ